VENKEISPIGSLKTVKINVRIIAATNKNLKEMVEKGAFREDLYFRLNVINIHVPPLRERKEDIPILSIYFANTIAVDEGGVLKNIDAEALDILKNYNFKGNVRELKNLIYRAYLSCENSIITKKDFEFLFGNEVKKTENIFENTMFFNSFKEIVERKYLETQLEKHKYSLKNTAQSLGLQVSNLSTKLKEIGISLKK
jgi:transcriptional regulator with PAS, ATPase and Fis domain